MEGKSGMGTGTGKRRVKAGLGQGIGQQHLTAPHLRLHEILTHHASSWLGA